MMKFIALGVLMISACSGDSSGLLQTLYKPGADASSVDARETMGQMDANLSLDVPVAFDAVHDVVTATPEVSPEVSHHPDGIKVPCGITTGDACKKSLVCADTVCGTYDPHPTGCTTTEGTWYICVCCDGVYVCDVCDGAC